jgi:hypothetical protein
LKLSTPYRLKPGLHTTDPPDTGSSVKMRRLQGKMSRTGSEPFISPVLKGSSPEFGMTFSQQKLFSLRMGLASYENHSSIFQARMQFKKMQKDVAI